MRAKWLHVDLNAYFATLLQQENPFLRGRPIGVLKDVGRSCVIAASKEAKLLGVQTGCSKREAQELAPGILFVPASWTLSLASTKKFKAILDSLTPTVEIFSLDEGFLFLDDCQNLYPDPSVLAQNLQQRVKEELGEWVTCNVGLAPNRFLAKLTSERAPKGSITVVNEENTESLLAEAEFRDACGIGYRLEKRLRQLGANHPWAINLLDDEVLLKEFGPHWASELRKMGQGLEPEFLQRHNERALQPMKSVGRSVTGFQMCSDSTEIHRVLRNLVEEASFKAREQALAGREVWVALWGRDTYWSDHRLLAHHINRPSEIFAHVKELLQKRPSEFPVIKFAVRLGKLEHTQELPLSLLPQSQKEEQIALACDKIVKKYGLFSIRPATLLDHRRIMRPEVTGFLGDQSFQLRSSTSWN